MQKANKNILSFPGIDSFIVNKKGSINYANFAPIRIIGPENNPYSIYGLGSDVPHNYINTLNEQGQIIEQDQFYGLGSDVPHNYENTLNEQGQIIEQDQLGGVVPYNSPKNEGPPPVINANENTDTHKQINDSPVINGDNILQTATVKTPADINTKSNSLTGDTVINNKKPFPWVTVVIAAGILVAAIGVKMLFTGKKV